MDVENKGAEARFCRAYLRTMDPERAAGEVDRRDGFALLGKEADPERLDLSALSELKVTERGVEIKLVDRVRALEALCALLDQGDGGGAEALYQALEEAARGLEAADGM